MRERHHQAGACTAFQLPDLFSGRQSGWARDASDTVSEAGRLFSVMKIHTYCTVGSDRGSSELSTSARGKPPEKGRITPG